MNVRLKSAAISLLTTLVDVSLFCLCAFLLMGETALVVARFACGVVGAGCNFLLNRSLAFGRRGAGAFRQARRYGVTALGAVTLATAVWAVLRWLTGLDVRLLHPVSLGLVWLVFTFPLLRGWVFSEGRRQVQ
jgi:putative flippase GtrA